MEQETGDHIYLKKRSSSRAKKLICPILLLIVLLCVGAAYILVSKISDSAQLEKVTFDDMVARINEME